MVGEWHRRDIRRRGHRVRPRVRIISLGWAGVRVRAVVLVRDREASRRHGDCASWQLFTNGTLGWPDRNGTDRIGSEQIGSDRMHNLGGCVCVCVYSTLGRGGAVCVCVSRAGRGFGRRACTKNVFSIFPHAADASPSFTYHPCLTILGTTQSQSRRRSRQKALLRVSRSYNSRRLDNALAWRRQTVGAADRSAPHPGGCYT